MADDQLRFRAEIEQLFRAYPWELSAENKELIVRQARKIGVGKLTPASVEWARQHLERMQENRERLDQRALAETLEIPAPDAKRHREPTPGHVRLKPHELARELAAWGHIERTEPPPPDWEIWSRMGDRELWEAVVLTLNFDPGYFLLYDDGAGNLTPLPHQANEVPPQVALHGLLPDKAQRDISGRLMVAASNLPGRSLIESLRPEIRRPVNLSNFGSLARKLWLDVPAEFPPGTTNINEKSPSASRWPWGTHETDQLRIIAKAGQHFFSQKGTRPSKKEVVAWLMENGVEIRRTAEIMAQILCGK